MSGDQQPNCGSQQCQRALRYNQQTAAVEPVGNDAAIKAEKHKWPKLKCVGDAKGQAGIGQLQDQPILGRDLDPSTNVGSDLRREIDPKIGIPQTNKCCVETMQQDLTALRFSHARLVIAPTYQLRQPVTASSSATVLRLPDRRRQRSGRCRPNPLRLATPRGVVLQTIPKAPVPKLQRPRRVMHRGWQPPDHTEKGQQWSPERPGKSPEL